MEVSMENKGGTSSIMFSKKARPAILLRTKLTRISPSRLILEKTWLLMKSFMLSFANLPLISS